MDGRAFRWLRWLAVLPCAPWVAKAVAAALMGPVFLLTAWCIAPHSKWLVAALALGVVVIWGLSLAIGSFQETRPDWLLATGLCGITGGAVAFRLTRCCAHQGLC